MNIFSAIIHLAQRLIWQVIKYLLKESEFKNVYALCKKKFYFYKKLEKKMKKLKKLYMKILHVKKP